MRRLEEPQRRPAQSVIARAARPRSPYLTAGALDGLFAAGSPAQRHVRLSRLNACVGNRSMARMVAEGRRLARTPTPPPAVAPVVQLPAAATARLTAMGVDAAKIAALQRGELILHEIKVAGGQSTIALLQVKPGLLRGGIFSIAVPHDPNAAVKAFFGFRQPILELGRDMGLAEIELFGAAIHNAKIEAMLKRQGFVLTKELIPEYLGLGPATEVEVMSKRFPVPGVKPPAGGGPPTGGGVAPPAVGGGPPARAPGDPAAKPPTAKGPQTPPKGSGSGGPATGGPKVTGGGTGAPAGEVVVARPRIRMGSVAGLAGNVIVTAALWWFSSKLKEWEQQRVASQFAAKVDPKVRDALVKLAPKAEKLTLEDPAQPVYVNVTVDVSYGGWHGPGGSESIYDVDFVGPVEVSRTRVASEHIVRDSSDCVSGGGYGCSKSTVRRVTYSLEVQFDETKEQHFWRVMTAQAAEEVRMGRPARRMAELGDWEELPKPGKKRDDRWRQRDEQRRKEALTFKIRWTRLYIEAAAKRLEYRELYDEAREYLDELEGRPVKPRVGPVLRPGPRTPAERKELEEWLDLNK